MSCGVGCRHNSDPSLLWLWCWPVAAAPTQLSPANNTCTGAVLKRPKKKKKKEEEEEEETNKQKDLVTV